MNIKDYKYKIETHAHTSPMSPCADFTPEEVIKKYAADFMFCGIFFITNYYISHLSGELQYQGIF